MTNFVLIHGANQGGWIWQPTAARLRAAGHLVHLSQHFRRFHFERMFRLFVIGLREFSSPVFES